MRPEACDWAKKALAEQSTLWLAARKRGPKFTLQGRAPLMVVPGQDQGTLWVIRRYWRGGRMTVLEDRHLRLGIRRPVLEALSSEALRAKGIETPRVVGGSVYDSGIFYRADLVTEFISESVDLRALLFAPEEPWRSDISLRLGAVAKVGVLVARLAAAGASHPDLNAANLLLRLENTLATPVVIDLDRCSVAKGSVPVDPMLNRLKRSIAKSASAMGAPFPTEAWSILERGTREGTLRSER